MGIKKLWDIFWESIYQATGVIVKIILYVILFFLSLMFFIASTGATVFFILYLLGYVPTEIDEHSDHR